MIKNQSRSRAAASSVTLYPYAWTVIAAYFGWGFAGIWNKDEQICALGGHIDGTAIKVAVALPMISSGSSPGHVAIKAETWMNAIWTLEDMGLTLVGSAHSHPNALPVFLSGDDLYTHMRMFPKGASIILNPHRCEIKAFNQTRCIIPIHIVKQQEVNRHETLQIAAKSVGHADTAPSRNTWTRDSAFAARKNRTSSPSIYRPSINRNPAPNHCRIP